MALLVVAWSTVIEDTASLYICLNGWSVESVCGEYMQLTAWPTLLMFNVILNSPAETVENHERNTNKGRGLLGMRKLAPVVHSLTARQVCITKHGVIHLTYKHGTGMCIQVSYGWVI